MSLTKKWKLRDYIGLFESLELNLALELKLREPICPKKTSMRVAKEREDTSLNFHQEAESESIHTDCRKSNNKQTLQFTNCLHKIIYKMHLWCTEIEIKPHAQSYM